MAKRNLNEDFKEFIGLLTKMKLATSQPVASWKPPHNLIPNAIQLFVAAYQ
jgi:hypothetical protein